MTKEEKIEQLRKKILSRLNEEEFHYDGNEVGFYELVNACKDIFSPYVHYFNDTLKTSIKKINRSSKISNLFGINVPFIDKIVPSVTNGNELISIYLSNKHNQNDGVIEINSDGQINYIGDNDDLINLSKAEYIEFMDNIRLHYVNIITALKNFKYNFEDVDYKWDFSKNENNTLNVSDGFLRGNINLNNVSDSYVALSNVDDITLATSRSKNHGIIYDYVEFYNDALKKRLKVNIDDLSPLFKKILYMHLGLEKEKELKLER